MFVTFSKWFPTNKSLKLRNLQEVIRSSIYKSGSLNLFILCHAIHLYGMDPLSNFCSRNIKHLYLLQYSGNYRHINAKFNSFANRP